MYWMMNENPDDCSDLDPVEAGLPEGVKEYKGDPERRRRAGRMIGVAVISGMAVLFVLLLLFIRAVVIDGDSMYPQLHNGDRILMEKASYLFGSPQRFDVIVFRPYKEEKETLLVKRVIGLPGETVWIHNQTVYIDGKVLEGQYGSGPGLLEGRAGTPVHLNENEYFVLGDNHIDSLDSRSEEVGSVEGKSIEGRAFYRIRSGRGAFVRHR